jgi:predicted nucleotidyltransferase
MPEGRLFASLRALQEGGVEFIVVGGVAAVLNGAPIATYDVDVVYSRKAENIEALSGVLARVEAVFRAQPERRLRPAASHLAAGGHLNLLTRYGPLDLLGAIGRNLGYEELLSHSREFEIGGGVRIRVLDLETLIEVKEQLGGEKDLAVLPVLRRTLSEIRKARISEK